jgi:diguanylate cyclase (GGDEF)-like protein/PAS domain S-box-containing protein
MGGFSLKNSLYQLQALKDFNNSVASENKELEAYINVMEEYVYTTKTDKKGTITKVSDSFCRLTGFSREEFIGKTHNIIRSPEMEDAFFSKLWDTILKENIWEGDIKDIKKDDSVFWMHTIIFPQYNIKKELIGYASIRHNITASKKLEQEVIHDGLTDLYNRRYYDEIIEKELMRAKREKENFTFVMMDIDYFKLYNDTYGHLEGDKALKEVAKLLTHKLDRASDFCFRLGGEEFGFFFAGQSLEESTNYVKKICSEIEKLHIPHSKNKASDYLTASFGLINVNMGTSACHEQFLYTAADNALYKAKKEGRNQVAIHVNN